MEAWVPPWPSVSFFSLLLYCHLRSRQSLLVQGLRSCFKNGCSMGSLCASRSFSLYRSSFVSPCSSLFRSFTMSRAREFAATSFVRFQTHSLPLELDLSHNITKTRDTFRPSDPCPTPKSTRICLILVFSFRSTRRVSSKSCTSPLPLPPFYARSASSITLSYFPVSTQRSLGTPQLRARDTSFCMDRLEF
jgi:hypothetical protein